MIRKSKFILLFWILGCSVLFGQKQKVKNQRDIDGRLLHFGFSIGTHAQDLLLTNSGYTENGESWFCEIPEYSMGFSVSLITDLRLNPYMNLRFSPTMHFGDKRFQYEKFIGAEDTGESYKTTIRSNYLTFPLDLKVASLRLNNYRPYFLAGVYGAFDVGRQKEQALLLKTVDYGIEFGLGCDFYLPIIKVCPEIKFCFGFADLIEQNRSDLRDKDLLKYTQALSKGTSRMIVISFAFE